MAELIIAGLTALKATSAVTFLSTVGGRLLLTVAVSALQVAVSKQKRPQKLDAPQQGGIKTDFTQTGGINPVSFVLGRYATGGNADAPPMSHGESNRYLTYVISVGDLPGHSLRRIIVDDAYVDIGPTPLSDYGLPMQGRLLGNGWVKFHDGRQTTADPWLTSTFWNYPERPWLGDMPGFGVSYAIVTFLFDREKFNGLPRVRFEVDGVPLYDPRQDGSVGGTGAQRWDNPATWTQTENPVVMIYNILRGIRLPDNTVWGGDAQADALPLANWFAAMNECDVIVPHQIGGTVSYATQFRAGFEVTVDETPASVIEDLLKGCAGQIAPVGDTYKVRVGGPGLPVYVFTDDDVIVTRPEDLMPFPTLDKTFNGVHGSYPDPDALWQQKDAPPIYDEELRASDDGRQSVATLTMSAVPYPAQVARVMAAYLKEERRFRRHLLTLPPDAAILEPLDAVAWTSGRNGYVGKVFEVAQVSDDPQTLLQQVSLRERDDEDFVPEVVTVPAVPSSVALIPAAEAVAGWSVTPEVIYDSAGAARRPALRLSWSALPPDARGITWEIRLASTQLVVLSGSTQVTAAGTIVVADGILPATGYQASATLLADRATIRTPWLSAVTANLRVSINDLADDVTGAIARAAASAAQDVAGAESALAGAETAAAIAVDRNRQGLAASVSALDLAATAAVRALTGNWDFRDGWTGWVTSEDLTADPALLDDIRVGILTGDETDTAFEVADQAAIANAIMRNVLLISGDENG